MYSNYQTPQKPLRGQPNPSPSFDNSRIRDDSSEDEWISQNPLPTLDRSHTPHESAEHTRRLNQWHREFQTYKNARFHRKWIERERNRQRHQNTPPNPTYSRQVSQNFVASNRTYQQPPPPPPPPPTFLRARPAAAMPPQVSRMHPSHMSNPFVHLNAQHSIPQSSYQSQPSHLPGSFNSQPGFGGTAINGGISPFPSSSTYGANAFTPGASSSVFNGGAIGGQGQGLASVAAQQGFARGAAMQEHSAHQLEAASLDNKSGANSRIRQVWRHNLEQEMAVLRQLIIKYPYVSMVRHHFHCEISGRTASCGDIDVA